MEKHHRRRNVSKKSSIFLVSSKWYASNMAFLLKDNDVEMTDVGGDGSGASSPGIGLAGETKFV
jgi:hypothetical protein